MTTNTRLDKVAGALTPRQLALLEVRAMRQFPNLTAHATAIADGRVGHTSLCDKIRDSVRAANKGAKEAALRPILWEAYREGLFLCQLAHTCNLHLEECRYALQVERRYVGTLFFGMYLAVQGDQEWPEHLPDPAEEIEKLLHHVRAKQDGVALIEKEYFDGQPILYPDAAAWLAEELDTAQSLYDLVAEMPSVKERATTPQEARARAHKQAMEWITVARAEVHQKLGEDDQARALLRPHAVANR